MLLLSLKWVKLEDSQPTLMYIGYLSFYNPFLEAASQRFKANLNVNCLLFIYSFMI